MNEKNHRWLEIRWNGRNEERLRKMKEKKEKKEAKWRGRCNHA